MRTIAASARVAGFDGIYHERDAVRRFWQTFLAEFGELHIEVDELIDCGERVFSAVRVAAAAATMGRQLGATVYPVFTVREGLVVRYQLFIERRDAVEAAGLAE